MAVSAKLGSFFKTYPIVGRYAKKFIYPRHQSFRIKPFLLNYQTQSSKYSNLFTSPRLSSITIKMAATMPAPKTLKNGLVVQCAVPFPRPPPTAEDRIGVLEQALDPKSNNYMPHQKTNIEALIRMYKEGEIKIGDELFLVHGQKVTRTEAENGKKTHFHVRVCAILITWFLIRNRKSVKVSISALGKHRTVIHSLLIATRYSHLSRLLQCLELYNLFSALDLR
jgi:hypothetical protein